MKHFYARVLGKLLGDGSISKSNDNYARLQFHHRIEDACWTEYCYQQLKDYIPFTPPKKRFSTNPINHYFYFVRSRKSDIILELHERWYPNDGKKKIPFDLLERYMTEETLAWWYQDDGHLKIERNYPSRIILGTYGFAVEENEQMIQLLHNKFQLNFKRDGQNRLVLNDKYQTYHFLSLVDPWIQPCMKRKRNTYPLPKPLAQKPAIRLPKQIRLKAPTKDMNEALETLDDFFTNEKVDMHKVAKHFLPRTFPNIEKRHYQVRLTDANRKRLYTLQHYTGLTLSELATYCFTKKPSSDR